MNERWTRDEPQFYELFSREFGTSRDLGLLHSAESCIVSRDTVSGAATYLLRIPPEWRWAEDAEVGTVELFVLEGKLSLDGSIVPAGGYASLPQGSGGGELASDAGAAALLFWNPDMPQFPPPYSRMRATSYRKEPWHPTLDRQTLHGTFYKSLRLPDFSEGFDGGPGGFLRMFVQTPGNADARQHVHHECWEEMIILRGDMYMPERGVVGPGTYLANPQEFWHAPMVSHGGCVMLTHTDAPMGPWGTRAYPDGAALIEDYLDTSSWIDSPRHRAWDDVPEWLATQDRTEYREWRNAPEWDEWSAEVGRGAAARSRTAWRRVGS